ncbi:MAG: hypothetical protein QOD80_1555, partial [Verrucomicrobiota bacterium]
YTPLADALLLGRVLAVHGTLDRRDDSLRAVAQRAKILTTKSIAAPLPNESNGNGHAEKESPLVLSFSPAATGDELRQVQTILAASPGTRSVRLMLCRADGGFVQMDANLRISLTPELREKLGPWLQAIS